MAISENKSQSYSDEFTRIFDEYRARIEAITQKTKDNLQSINGLTDTTFNPDIAVDVEDEKLVEDEEATGDETPVAEEKLEDIVSRIEPESVERPVEVIWPSEKESVEIIKEAKRKAQQLISQAEENIKKEAKKKTRVQVERIIGKAKKEAEVFVARAVQATEKERDEAIATSKNESEQLISDLTEKCQQEAQSQASRVIAEAREKAEKMMADIVTSSTEINRLVTTIVNRARNTINEFEERLQSETGELAEVITETQKKLEQVTMIARQEETVPEPVIKNKESKEPVNNPTLSIRLLDNKGNGNNALYSGQVEVKTVSSSFDYQYLKNLKRHLANIPDIKYLQEFASEKEMSLMFDITEPLPLLDILGDVPSVDRVVAEADDDIRIIFNSSP